MTDTIASNVTYRIDAAGVAVRTYTYAEVLEALRDILPSSESHVESLTYCWGSQGDAELQDIVDEWQAKLRRAYEVAGVDPPEWSVFKRGHRGPNCPCTDEGSG